MAPRAEWISNCEGEASPVAGVEDATSADLGEPVPAGIEDAVIPTVATPANDGSEGGFHLPSGTTLSQLQGWYTEHMTPGEDFGSLAWLDQDQIEADWVYWFWCTPSGGLLTVSTMGGDQSTNDAAYLSVTADEDTGDECP